MIIIQKKKKLKSNKLEPGKILRIEAKSNYCKIFFIDCATPMVVSSVLNLVHKNLPADMFLRVHRSHLVNKLYLKEVTGTQTKTAELVNGESIVFSRRRLAMFYKTNDWQTNLITLPAS